LELLLTSFIAGILTILAPCVLPVIPLIVGGTLREGESKSLKRPLVIIGSLAVSIVAFTLLLKASTSAFHVPEQTLQWISGLIILAFGVTMLWPHIWEQLSLKLGFGNASNRLLAKASSKDGLWGDVLIGTALGPVFTSCSPTFGIILATVLPVSLAQGTIYLIAYAIGLAIMLLLVALLGGRLITKLGWATDPQSNFRRWLGAIFIIVGVVIIAGWDKDIQTWLIDLGIYDPISNIETGLQN